MSSTSEELARRIVERLIAEGLIDAKDSDRLRPKLGEGKLQSEDWRLLIEKASTSVRGV